ncbi:LytR/AlgR family response regulator transcription factor [Flagellimonas nanhaiensis]|uniref:DNA-binding response regulator n=1 Tax=Flagellimonas nanhaiensis TaxID=2292706 RepID=A0A371JSY0_9FLAO|nr:LytTR family DNA-binding domain-containing protein [Allomuricauda nanhaiensis]RDY60886.1 DNA-binding response regulator [Allomuricauda nanhaiensis]
MIKCLILEDEKAAQKVLRNFVEKTPFLVCSGVYESGLQIAPDELKEIDILFLDIQLPELNGLSFLKTLNHAPKIIVTTAFPNYAVEAFEEAVVDYLLKPFSYERFFKSVSRVSNILALQNQKKEKNIFVYADKTFYNVQIDDILFLKSEVDYVCLVTKNKEYLILDSLKNWKEKLSDHNFVQVHRSFIVSIGKIDKVIGNQIYIGKTKIPIGKHYKEDFLKLLK